MYKLFIFIAISILIILIYLVDLVKTKKIRTEYAILWFISLIIVFALTFSVNILDSIAVFLGVAYPSSLIVIVVIILGIIILLNLTQILSKFANEKKSKQEFINSYSGID